MKRRAEEEEDEEMEDDDVGVSRRLRWLGPLLLLSAIPICMLALAVFTGIGLQRNLPTSAALTGGLALVFLPIAGLTVLASTGGRRTDALGGCTWFWSLACLFALPFYLPGERSDASIAGLRLLTSPVPSETRTMLLTMGDTMISMLGSEPERIPNAVVLSGAGSPGAGEELADASEGKRPEKKRPDLDGEVVVPYDGDGQVIRIAVFFDGPRYGEEFPLIFDTGATYTTLTREALDLLEVDVPPDAPIAVLRTANGEIEAPLVLVDAAWLGAAVVEWVTVAVCDLCASEDIFGLLGLNVSGQFQISLDQTDREIRLTEQQGEMNRRLDIVQWVALSSRIRRWRDGRVEVEVTLRNRARAPISNATAEVACQDGTFEVRLEQIPAGGVEASRMALPRDTDCSDYQLELTHAQWQLDRF